MQEVEKVLGHEEVIRHLQNAVEKEQVSHSYIFAGEKGSGKKLLAKLFAMTLQCEEHKKEPCMHCSSCRKAMSRNHPDIIYVEHVKPTSIGIEEIREQLVSDVEIKPYTGPYKIYIVDEAEKMNVAAQNAILKTIEEPPEYAIIFLLTTNRGAFLDTILSRCILLETKPVSGKMIERYLGERYKIPEEEAEFASGFSLGNIGKSESIILSEEFRELKDLTLDILRYVHEIESYEIADKVKEYKKYKARIDDFFDIFLMWFRDILLLKADTSPDKDIARRKIIFKNEYISLRKQADKLKMDSIDYIINRINRARSRIKSNVNFDATLELLIVEARREF